MYKSATKCNKTVGKWCKNKHGASKIIDTLDTYQLSTRIDDRRGGCVGLIATHVAKKSNAREGGCVLIVSQIL
jgi:hypothetical protein